MTLPALLLGLVLSSLYGFAFHFWRGGGLGRMILYVTLSWIGFWAGHALAAASGWVWGVYGTLHLGMGTLGSVFFLLAGHWLSLIETNQP